MSQIRKEKAQDILEMVAKRVSIIDEMIQGQRPSNESIAKQYMREIKNGLDKVNEIIDII